MKNILAVCMLLLGFCAAAQSWDTDKNQQKKYKNAIKKFNKQNDSASYIFYCKRGGIRCDYKDFAGSLKDYDKAVAMVPDSAHCYYDRGLAKLDAKMYTEAIADFDIAIQLKPDYDYAYNNRGICYFYLEDYSNAMTNYTTAIKINPENAFAYNNRGSAEIKLGLADKACDDFYKAYDLGDKKSSNAIKKYCEKK